jgi:transposase
MWALLRLPRLGSISKQRDRYLRSLFVAGALAVIRYAKVHGTKHRPWLTALLGRPGRAR